MINELNEIIELYDDFIFVNEQDVTQLIAVKENKNTIKINFNGSNISGLFFIFNNKLNSQCQELINNLVTKAIKINMDDVVTVCLSENPELTFSLLENQLLPKKIIIWGSNEWVAEIQTIPYQEQKIQDVRILLVDDVNLFISDIALKTKLWNTIQILLK